MEKSNRLVLLIIFVIFPFFNPTSLKYIPSTLGLYNLIQMWKLAIIIIALVIFVLHGRISLFDVLITVYVFAGIATSLYNHVNDSKVFTNALLILGLVAVAEILMPNYRTELVKAGYIVTVSLALINLILSLKFPRGLEIASLYTYAANPLYFLGIDNAMVKQMLPFLAFSELYCYEHRRVWKTSTYSIIRSASFIIAILNIIITGSATGLFVLLLFSLISVLFSVGLLKRFPFKLFISAFTFFEIFVVFFASSSTFFSQFTELLGRSATFTGRTYLWEYAIKMINQRLVWGYGYTSGNISAWGKEFSSHNILLELLIQGGIIYLVPFILLIMYYFMCSPQYQNYIWTTISSLIASFLVIGLMESGVNEFMFFFMILGVRGSRVLPESTISKIKSTRKMSPRYVI